MEVHTLFIDLEYGYFLDHGVQVTIRRTSHCYGLCRTFPCSCEWEDDVYIETNLDLPNAWRIGMRFPIAWWAKQDVEVKDREMGEFIKKAAATRRAHFKEAPPDEAFQMEYPALWDFLTSTTDENGKPRKASTITLFADAGAAKASINDKQGKASAFVSSDTFLGALRALDGALQEGTAEWKPWGTDGQSRKQR